MSKLPPRSEMYYTVSEDPRLGASSWHDLENVVDKINLLVE